MDSKRQHKFSRQIQKDLSEIFQRDPRHFFNNSLVTITGVEVSPDLGFAKVYLSVFPVKDVEDVFYNIEQKKGEIRKLLGNKIGKRVRIVPELAFFHDNTEEEASKIDRLIDNLNIPPDKNTDQP
tara:strand:- start:324 stop:698 length:375 start_codon:yes stop_codon:yes gene_type:complete